jgi:LuxR family maltose regulon positive regulatory protein
MLAPQSVSYIIETLTDELPEAARIVLVGSGSGLPANSLVRLADDLTELRAVDLWWSRDELIGQLVRVAGITVTQSQADEMHRLTGGWPAGAIILGRAMRARPSVLEVPDLTLVPEVLDFVTAEVLNRLAAPLRRFVLRTSVLDEPTMDDFEVLVPGENPHALLAEVHRQGLTVDVWPSSVDPTPTAGKHPLAQQPPVLHPLVAAAARRELRASELGAERNLLRTTGEHARRQDRAVDAVRRLAAADDWEAVLAVLLAAAGDGFRDWSPTVLRATVRGLPSRVWALDVERRALVAFAAAMAGDQMFAAQVIQQTVDVEAEWWPVLARIIEAVPGHTGGSHSGYRAACAALVSLPTLDRATPVPPILGVVDRPSLIAVAHLLAARAGVFDRDQISVRRHLEAGWSEPGAQVPRYCVLAGLGADALTAAWGGQLVAADRRAGRALRLAGEAGLAEHSMLSLARLARVEVLRARGRTEAAWAELEVAEPALERSEPFVATASGGRVHTSSAWILRAMLEVDRADPEAARAELIRLHTEGDDDPPRNLAAGRAVAWARWHLLADDVTAAEQALSTAPDTGTVAAVRILAALHRQAPEEAQALLQSWPFEDTLDNRIRRLLASAAVAVALGRRTEAGDEIDEALVAAEPDGHVQVFLDAPPRARALVTAVLKRSLGASSWRAELADRLDTVRALSAESGSVPVTRRERAVLEQLTTTLTHAQIAGRLFVSENTLKSHCRNLYRKLGVSTRADAVRTARARGWLEPVQIDLSPEGDVVLDANITPVPVVVEL